MTAARLADASAPRARRGQRDVRVGLVGAGYVCAYHIKALRTLPGVRIVGIADTAIDRAREIAQRFDIPGVFSTVIDMQRARPDVVHVLTPPASHARVAIDALEMGCDVFVEKPMAAAAAECDAMIAAARRTGRVLSVNHSAVEDPVVVRALERLRQDECGEILSVDFYRSSDYPGYAGGALPPAFRQGGYPLLDMGVHALSLMEAFLGPVLDLDVRYRSTGQDPQVFFDDWRGHATCARGSGAFYLSWSARPIRNEIFVHGTRGDMHVDCFLQTCTVRKPLPLPKPIASSLNAVAHAARTVYEVPKNLARFATGSLRPSPGIHAGVLRFHEALARDANPPVSMEAGRRLIAALEPFCRGADEQRNRTLRVNEALEPRDVLVTGAAGLLGRALVERLRRRGDSIRVLVRRHSPVLEALPDVQVVYGDLGDPDAVDRAVAGVRLVYHAGAAMRARGWADFEAGTVRGTANVVQSCLKHGVERLIHVSSLTVLDYAGQRPRAVVDERAPLEPHADLRGSYTQAKLLAERIVAEACGREGLETVIVRPGQIVGPGYETVAPYGAIALGRRWIGVGSGDLPLPLVHVDDVVDGLIAAGERAGARGSIFHLVDPTRVSQRDYIAGCREATHGRIKAIYVPRVALLAAGLALDLLSPLVRRTLPLSRYRIKSINGLTFDCSAARDRLDWTPRRAVSPTTSDAVVNERPLPFGSTAT